jgi:glutaredoxin 3
MYTVYTKSNCPNCVKAKALLSNKGLEYTEQIIGVDLTRELVIEMFPGVKAVPIIKLDDKLIGGYDDLKKLFNEKE